MAENRTSRIIEVAVTIAVSASASAAAVLWSNSIVLQEIKTRQQEQERRIVTVESTLASEQSLNSLQSTQLAVNEANYKNIILSLDEIKQRLMRRAP